LDQLKPTTAFDGTKYVGTDKLGRPLNDAEKMELAALLRKHDFVAASLEALGYAFGRTRNRAAAQDLLGRARDRLVRQGWDPRRVQLTVCLKRFVKSEASHELRAMATARKAEEGFVRERGLQHADEEPSFEDRVCELETEQDQEARAKERIGELRAEFVKAGDTINQIWLDYRLAGVDQPAEMARLSGHDVNSFYRATDRRKRIVADLRERASGAKEEESK
jgi:hypothetical protein